MDNFCDVVDALEEQGIEKYMDVSHTGPLVPEQIFIDLIWWNFSVIQCSHHCRVQNY